MLQILKVVILNNSHGSEVSTTANVQNQDGELEYGEQPTSDEFAKMQAIQNYWANAHKGARVMP